MKQVETDYFFNSIKLWKFSFFLHLFLSIVCWLDADRTECKLEGRAYTYEIIGEVQYTSPERSLQNIDSLIKNYERKKHMHR